MNKILKKDDVNFLTFDPALVDTSEIQELSSMIPRDGNIDLNKAEVLATKFLRGADMCGELQSISIAYVGKTEAEKKKAYANAALVKATQAGYKTDKSRAWFADMDSDYIDAVNKHNTALAFVDWIEGKHKSFEKMHYLCKRIMERGYGIEKAANWSGQSEEEKDEKPW